MPAVDEALTAPNPLASDLAAGVKVISQERTITFTLYNRAVLPLDGYVFWVKTSPADTREASGSLHYSSDTEQGEAENYAINRVVFTALEEIEDMNEVAPDQLWIGVIDGIQFSFTSRGSFYQQANVYHYVGNAVYPDMARQIVNLSTDLDPTKVIVSNCLPLWLALNGYAPPNPGLGFAMPVTLFPSFLSPQNLVPPFATVDIQDGSTEGIMAAPLLLSDGSHAQLVTDRVKVTLWGLNNEEALSFIDCVNAYSLNYDTFGIMNIPVIRDDKRTQSELGTLAQKKSAIFDVSYYQYTARAIARQLIVDARATFLLGS